MKVQIAVTRRGVEREFPGDSAARGWHSGRHGRQRNSPSAPETGKRSSSSGLIKKWAGADHHQQQQQKKKEEKKKKREQEAPPDRRERAKEPKKAPSRPHTNLALPPGAGRTLSQAVSTPQSLAHILSRHGHALHSN
ncbi:uncharacterized protein CIMG_13058 [Coccidioides immitis RS]|uniref:Uncharacterized protein n=1 Tax=Coccidioides immitis (strain RS) TaxID=246410 RepID=A0A0D8JWB7_COCIM|nr:uncharacterized protein CIMG_13058 [Coccidioides immitis RS]KJF60588.1 hypothetical protein CIMG_13058 [Coccidioides immitis RS]